MCTLAIYRDCCRRYPVIVAANRDEFLARPTQPPAAWPNGLPVVAGRDEKAGGTWLGCRTDGAVLIAGLLNRSTATPSTALPRKVGPEDSRTLRPTPSSGERSRGLLCLEALAEADLDGALALIQACDPKAYGSFNLLVADAHRAVVVDNSADLRTTELDSGLSVLTNRDVNDPRCPRNATARKAFADLVPMLEEEPAAEQIISALSGVLGDHRNSVEPDNPLARLCIHAPTYGTRSSSAILFDQSGGLTYHHADGPPCKTPFLPVSLPAVSH